MPMANSCISTADSAASSSPKRCLQGMEISIWNSCLSSIQAQVAASLVYTLHLIPICLCSRHLELSQSHKPQHVTEGRSASARSYFTTLLTVPNISLAPDPLAFVFAFDLCFQVTVVEPEAYAFDEEALNKAAALGKPGLVEIKQRQDQFIFRVEGTGVLPVGAVLVGRCHVTCYIPADINYLAFTLIQIVCWLCWFTCKYMAQERSGACSAIWQVVIGEDT